MARRVFFSFHYERDIWRVSQVRNCWVTRDREAAGFWDAAEWGKVKSGGQPAVENWIKTQLYGTSVTVVLIGAETSNRYYVGYEIQQSYDKGNGLLGIYIHNMKDVMGRGDTRGENPFGNWHVNNTLLSDIYPTYNWVIDSGRENIGWWIEEAAKKAER